MFSEQYKNENEQLRLDEDFLERLKLNMRKEKERLDHIENVVPFQPSNKIKDDCISNKEGSHKTHSKPRMSHLLPLTLTACAALLLITLIPSIYTKQEDKCSSEPEMNFADSTESVEKTEEFQIKNSQDYKADTSTTCEAGPSEEETYEATMEESIGSATSTEKEMYSCDAITFTDVSQSLKDAEFPVLDGVINQQLIFHTSSKLFFYDIKVQQLINTVNLEDQIGSYEQKGETMLKVQITEDETALILSNPVSSSFYRYDLDTHEFMTMAESELYDITYLNTDDKLLTDTSMFDGLIHPTNRSHTCWSLGNHTYDILYYQCIEDQTIASLSIRQVSLAEDGAVLEETILPIFGEDTITELQNNGYKLSGNQ